MKVIASLGLLILVASVFLGNPAFAESLDNIRISVSNYDGNSATVKITWNHDDKTTNYKIGCVSCNPNTEKFTTGDSITFNNVTPFPNSSSAMLYVITYDSENKIISAKQLIVDLGQ
ncbi:MAG: conserved exported protein of unknown function [Nitrosopumilales archaeon]|nr:MAG: conserved exported protein of unknown function [Nitrosopumilales archaeon]